MKFAGNHRKHILHRVWNAPMEYETAGMQTAKLSKLDTQINLYDFFPSVWCNQFAICSVDDVIGSALHIVKRCFV